MPLETFFNLSEDRQKEIINIAFEEFALYDFDSASLASIIKKLNLAKGSFYRYFNNKLDLYIFLGQFADTLVANRFAQYLNNFGEDFFQNWTSFFLSLREIEKEYPMAIRFRFKAAFEQSKMLVSINRIEKHRDRTKFMSSILKSYQDKGLIRKDIDLEFFSLFMTFFNFALSEYINIKYEIPFTSPVYSLNEESLKKDVMNSVNIIKNGVKP
jgi:AcrR family transcriptional regulator